MNRQYRVLAPRSGRQIGYLLAARFLLCARRLSAHGEQVNFVRVDHLTINPENVNALARDAPVIVARAIEHLESRLAERGMRAPSELGQIRIGW